jgi:hypothetical protein
MLPLSRTNRPSNAADGNHSRECAMQPCALERRVHPPLDDNILHGLTLLYLR